MASTSPAQLAAQMLGSLARVGAFVGVGATAVASAMYDGTRDRTILFSLLDLLVVGVILFNFTPFDVYQRQPPGGCVDEEHTDDRFE